MYPRRSAIGFAYAASWLCSSFMLTAAASAEPLLTGDFAVLEGPSISVSWPADWRFSASASKEWPEGTLQFAYPTSADFLLLVSPLARSSGPDAASLLPDAAAIRERVGAIGRSQLASAVEPELEVIELHGGEASGSYFVLTDAAPKPGEFVRMAQGILAVGRARLTFTALFHEAEPPQLAQALALLRSLRSSASDALRFTVPAAPWTLELAHPRTTLNISRVSADGTKGYFMATVDGLKFPVSFLIEPAVKCGTSAECADVIERGGFAHLGKVEDVRRFEVDGISIIECHLPKLAGKRFKQQHWFAQFVVDGYWVDAHLSKVLFKPKDRGALEAIVRALRFVPRAVASPVRPPSPP